MSGFSGKCDFFDEIDIFGLDCILNSKVYVGDSREPLELHCRVHCVPYYPYIIASSYMDNVEKKGIIHLTAKSWVDIEAERYGEMGIHQYYRDKLRNEMEKAAAEGENYGKE